MMALAGVELENARFRDRRADHSTTSMCYAEKEQKLSVSTEINGNTYPYPIIYRLLGNVCLKLSLKFQNYRS